tara:strand:- start:92 stop:1222 length:1131 start_codon:yes stop_codon:yes gene_type:complete
MKNNLLLFMTVFIISWLFFEIILTNYDEKTTSLKLWKLDAPYEDINLKDPNDWLKSEGFDFELGWDNPNKINNYQSSNNYIAQAYGNSFIQSGYGENNETWDIAFSKLSGGYGILNLGVQGYGLDQAVLKFEKYHKELKSKYKTKVAILGLYSEQFRRMLNYHSYYYFHNSYDNTFIYKPRFYKRDNEYDIFSPPCNNIDCFHEIVSGNKDSIGIFKANHDYFYKKNSHKPSLKFPRFISYVKAIPSYLNLRRQRNGDAPWSFLSDESIDLTKYLINRFILSSTNQKVVPIMILLYGERDLKKIFNGKREDKWLLKFFNENSIKFIDTTPYFYKYFKDKGEIKSLFVPNNGHYNTNGDFIVAKSIFDFFQKNKIIN